MCSIIGYCGKPFRYKDFSEGFARTVSRGPDDTQIITAGQGVLGFHRLSIMGLHPEGMQPFQLHGNALVCNGEIYGFEKFRKELEGEHTFVIVEPPRTSPVESADLKIPKVELYQSTPSWS